MGLSSELNHATPDEQESWILENATESGEALHQALEIFSQWVKGGDVKRVETNAELLQSAVKDDVAASLTLLAARVEWLGEPFRAECRRIARGLFDDRRLRGLVKHAGFDEKVPLAECVRRLDVLIKLKEGIYCEDGTWGFGRIADVDDFYERVTVDFDRKTGHQMSYRYAAETLHLVGDDHVLVRRVSDPAAFDALLKKNPGEVVRMLLATYGPMNVAILQERVTGSILAEEEWKRFWEAARKAMKTDPLIDMPSKRREPIRLLDSVKEYNEEWLLDFSGERDFARIIERLAEYEEAAGLPLGADAAEIVADRIRFLLLGTEGNEPALFVKGILAVDRLGLDEVLTALKERRRGLMRLDTWCGVTAAASVRELDALVAHMAANEGEAFIALLLESLNRMTFAPFSAVMDFLRANGHADAAAAVLARFFSTREISPVPLVWCCRNRTLAEEMNIVGVGVLFGIIADVIGRPQTGEALKMQNQLRVLLDDINWLKAAMDRMSAAEREHALIRMRDLRGWDETSRRAFMGKALKLYPEFSSVITGSREKAVPEEDLRLTSWRSYRERQEQLRKLVEVDIPENSKEIGVARSYGDLRENFEYQAAKDMQRILMQRQREMEADLLQVKGSDFAAVPTDTAGPGTCVEIVMPDGTSSTYVILGEWDRDESRGIISSKSLVAERLTGRRAGDEVMLPSDASDVACRVASVSDLTPAIRAWIGGGQDSA